MAQSLVPRAFTIASASPRSTTSSREIQSQVAGDEQVAQTQGSLASRLSMAARTSGNSPAAVKSGDETKKYCENDSPSGSKPIPRPVKSSNSRRNTPRKQSRQSDNSGRTGSRRFAALPLKYNMSGTSEAIHGRSSSR